MSLIVVNKIVRSLVLLFQLLGIYVMSRDLKYRECENLDNLLGIITVMLVEDVTQGEALLCNLKV